MPTGYQIKDQSAPHYLQLVYRIDLFLRQGQDLYALYKVSDTSYKSMGKITLLTYELKTLDMVIVPLEGVSYNFGDVQTELNKIYGPLGIEWRVKTDSVFRNKQFGLIMNDILDAEESQSFSMYSPEMRALNRLYKEQRGVDSKTMYMFVVKEINGKRGGLLGDMPLSSQFGYLAASNDATLAAKTIAHELGHGMFYLRHTFSQYNLDEGSTDNLMDYKPEGTQLFKKQWDEIFDPRRPWFAWRQDEEEGAAQLYPDPVCLQQILEQFRYAYVNNTKFTRASYGWPFLGNRAVDIELSDGNKYSRINVVIFQDVSSRPFLFAQSPQNSYKWGNVMKIDIAGEINNFHSYLFPSAQIWNEQMNNLALRISSETDRSKMISLLAIMPPSEYKRLSDQKVIDCILAIMSGFVTKDYLGCENDEHVLYNLITSLPTNRQSDFLRIFENDIIQMIRKFQGEYQDSVILKISQYIANVRGVVNPAEVFSYSLRSDGTIINRVFYWEESLGPDPLYQTTLTYTGNEVIVSVRKDWWFSDSQFLMNLKPTDFVGVLAKTPIPSLGIGPNDMVIMPAIKFHWLCAQRNKEEAWKRFVQGVDVAFTIGTLGTYGAAKTFKQVGTTFAIGMAMDYSIRLAINSLYYDKMEEAIANTSLLDAGWNSANVFISDPRLSVVLPCVREFSKAYFVDNISFAESTYQCAKTVILTMITKKAIPSNGSHANRIKALLQQQPIKTVVKLRDIGVDKESMLALARLLFTSTTDQAYVNVINSINDAY